MAATTPWKSFRLREVFWYQGVDFLYMPKNYNYTLVDNWVYPDGDIKTKNFTELKKEWPRLKGIEEKFSLNMSYAHCIEHVDCPFLYRFTGGGLPHRGFLEK